MSSSGTVTIMLGIALVGNGTQPISSFYPTAVTFGGHAMTNLGGASNNNVANATAQQSARIILESSLDMARKLNISSVAEGVETQEDWDFLRQLGCDLAQGYFIAKPMPAEELLSSSMYR